MNQLFKIPEALADKYHGAGHALASVTGGQMINLIYLSDVIDDFDGSDISGLPEVLNDPRLAPAVRLLQSTGEVFFGMCSCYEFVVL